MNLPGPLIQHIDCIRLHVADLEDGLAFYQEHLGLELIWRTRDTAGLRMPGDRAEIVLHTQKRKPEIDLKVERVDQAVPRIAAAGGKVVDGPFDIRIGQCAVVHDPWGNELVLVDTTRGLLRTDDQGWVTGNQDPE